MKYIYGLILLIIPFIGYTQDEIIGEEIISNYDTPHPYSGNSGSSYKIIWNQEITHENASYIAVHFNEVSLSFDDYLVIRNVDNTRSWNYSYAGIESKNNSFWTIPIYGEKAIIEIYSCLLYTSPSPRDRG